jgi:antitoxin ParD1/3/4
MKQTSMNISLSNDLREFVDQKLQRDRYSSASEYVRQLIREDLKREAREKVDQLLLEGLRSGPPKRVTKKDWEDIRKEVHARIAGAPTHAEKPHRPKARRTSRRR